MYANYTLVHASLWTQLELAAPDNPRAGGVQHAHNEEEEEVEEVSCIFVRPGR